MRNFSIAVTLGAASLVLVACNSSGDHTSTPPVADEPMNVVGAAESRPSRQELNEYYGVEESAPPAPTPGQLAERAALDTMTEEEQLAYLRSFND